MTEEEKNAIKRASYQLEITTFLTDIGHKDLEILLNLIQKQQAELEKKDNIIRELEEIFYDYELCEYELTDCTYRKCEYIADDEKAPCKDCIRQYFEKQVERNN